MCDFVVNWDRYGLMRCHARNGIELIDLFKFLTIVSTVNSLVLINPREF